MKKLGFTFIATIAMLISNAQDISDALRFASEDTRGTARFKAMAGAFGALGGDMSAVSINPAGSAVFSSSHASISLSNLNRDNALSFFNGNSLSSNSQFDLNQAGAVFVFENSNENSPWKKFTLGLAYDKSADFNNDWIVSGINTNNSIGNYFLEYAQGLRLDEISAFPGETLGEAYADIGSFFGFGNQQAFLGFESFILEPDSDTDDNVTYTSNIANGSYNQDYQYVSAGYNGKFTFNLATQYEDNLFFGLNVNTHFINYERFTSLIETNSNPGSLVNDVQFENGLLTTGTGLSFQFGSIAKLGDILRLGVSYTSPTWYRINDETTQYLATVRNDGGSNITQIINPNFTNIFPEYDLQTPGKLSGSAALVFGKQGLLSFDYSRKDFSNIRFRPTSDAFFAAQNSIISDNFKVANSYRFGGEYRIKQFSLRGGYRLEESPYEDENFQGDFTAYSAGLGYNFGKMKLDLAFEQSQQTTGTQLYSVGLTDSVTNDFENTDIIFTLSFDL